MFIMKKVRFETDIENKSIDLRCRDSCPCHCKHLNLNNSELPSVEYFK